MHTYATINMLVHNPVGLPEVHRDCDAAFSYIIEQAISLLLHGPTAPSITAFGEHLPIFAPSGRHRRDVDDTYVCQRFA